jgi:hypothetical protein
MKGQIAVTFCKTYIVERELGLVTCLIVKQ